MTRFGRRCAGLAGAAKAASALMVRSSNEAALMRTEWVTAPYFFTSPARRRRDSAAIRIWRSAREAGRRGHFAISRFKLETANAGGAVFGALLCEQVLAFVPDRPPLPPHVNPGACGLSRSRHDPPGSAGTSPSRTSRRRSSRQPSGAARSCSPRIRRRTGRRRWAWFRACCGRSEGTSARSQESLGSTTVRLNDSCQA